MINEENSNEVLMVRQKSLSAFEKIKSEMNGENQRMMNEYY